MKEISDIIRSYEEAKQSGERVALATVVHVEGSSYRRPGARMLVTDKGMITGAISGGCLEGDALRKALNAIAQQKNKIVTYDTTDEDVMFGVQLGCNGIVHILFEPVDYNDPENPVELLRLTLQTKREPVVLCTLFSLATEVGSQLGTALLFSEDKAYGKLPAEYGELEQRLAEDTKKAFLDKTSGIHEFELEAGTIYGFVELITPATSLFVVGAGNDAIPVVNIAKSLGWHVTVVDGRSTHATDQRFPQADALVVANANGAMERIEPDDRTAFVLMTHNYNYDLAMLELLLERPTPYVGCLGPKKKLDRMLAELEDKGVTITEDHLSKIFGPVGIDIGAETSEEIAVSIVAEINSIMSGKNSRGSLRDRETPIHDRFENDSSLAISKTTTRTRHNQVQTDSDADIAEVEGVSCAIDLALKS